jgi:hypothetical protein
MGIGSEGMVANCISPYNPCGNSDVIICNHSLQCNPYCLFARSCPPPTRRSTLSGWTQSSPCSAQMRPTQVQP